MIAMFNLGGGEILLLLMMFFLVPLAIAATVFWIWMLVHAVTNRGLTDVEKVMWVLIILFVHFIGALIYFFVGRPKQKTVPATS